MNKKELTEKAYQHVAANVEDTKVQQYEAGYLQALQDVLDKREEFGHGYLKSRLLDWILDVLK